MQLMESDIYKTLWHAAEAELASLSDGEVAAAMRLEDGAIVTGVSIPAAVDGAQLCAETGAICEAHRRHERVTHSLAMKKEEGIPVLLEGACGICQERLAVWGLDVLLAIEGEQFKTLRDLRPHYWDKSAT